MITTKVNELMESRGPRRGGRPVPEPGAEAVFGGMEIHANEQL